MIGRNPGAGRYSTSTHIKTDRDREMSKPLINKIMSTTDHTIDLRKDNVGVEELRMIEALPIMDENTMEPSVENINNLHGEIQKILLSYLKPVTKRDPKKKRIEIIIDLEVINEKQANDPEGITQTLETMKLNLIQQISKDVSAYAVSAGASVLQKGYHTQQVNVIQINMDINCK